MTTEERLEKLERELAREERLQKLERDIARVRQGEARRESNVPPQDSAADETQMGTASPHFHSFPLIVVPTRLTDAQKPGNPVGFARFLML